MSARPVFAASFVTRDKDGKVDSERCARVFAFMTTYASQNNAQLVHGFMDKVSTEAAGFDTAVPEFYEKEFPDAVGFFDPVSKKCNRSEMVAFVKERPHEVLIFEPIVPKSGVEQEYQLYTAAGANVRIVKESEF